MNIPLNINWQQILLHLLNFAILAGGLYFLLYNPVKKFMAQRIAHYEDMENAARQKAEEAQQLKAQYAEQLHSAEQEIHDMRMNAMKSVKTQTDQQLSDAAKQADAIVNEAKRTADRDRTKTIQDTQKELQDLAVTATEKLLLQSGGDAIDQFLNAAERGTSHVG